MPAARGPKSKTKTRRYTRDIDQIHADLSCDKHLKQYKQSKVIEDLPDMGRWYCTECAKWFDDEANLLAHKRSKVHKRRLKQLKDVPYSQKEANLAAGMTTDNGGQKV